jgi:hypothetical protein
MTDYRATPEQWADVGSWAKESPSSWDACILELRARVQSLEDDSWKQAESNSFWVDALVKRIEALEANSKPTPNPSQIRSSLVERVAIAISRCQDSSCWDDEAVNWEPEARAAIREVLAWLKEGEHTWAALKLEQDAER